MVSTAVDSIRSNSAGRNAHGAAQSLGGGARRATVKPDVLGDIDQWEFELDLLGASASREQLQQLLERCPDPTSDSAQFLAGFLSRAAVMGNDA